MIAKASTGTGFGGLARYLLTGSDGNHPERVEWTAVRNLPFENPELSSSVMGATATLNSRVEKPVFHVSIGWPPEEKPTRAEIEETADRVLKDLGLQEHQALLVAHNDTDHTHVHLMVNRVHPDTLTTWRNGHDWQRIEDSLRQIEKEKGWRRVPGHHGRISEASHQEAASIKDRSREPLRTARSWHDLEEKLATKGLALRARGRGLVVTDGSLYVKASAIHRSFSRPQLEERFRQTYRGWRNEVRAVHQIARQHQRLTKRAEKAVQSRSRLPVQKAATTPLALRAQAGRLRQGADSLRRGLEGRGDPQMLERKLMSFAFRFGMETLARVSPPAAAIVNAARLAKRTLDRGRGDRSR